MSQFNLNLTDKRTYTYRDGYYWNCVYLTPKYATIAQYDQNKKRLHMHSVRPNSKTNYKNDLDVTVNTLGKNSVNITVSPADKEIKILSLPTKTIKNDSRGSKNIITLIVLIIFFIILIGRK